MIGNKLEQSIIRVFEENLSETFSINSISKHLKKSYPNINRKMHFLIGEGILGKMDVGNSYRCYLNLNNDKAKILLAMIEINKKDSLTQKDPRMKNMLPELFQLGKRYAIETVVMHKKNLIFITGDLRHREDILERTLLSQEFNILFLSRKEFQKQFLNNHDLRKYHYVLLNTENYVNIISELNDAFVTKKILEQASNSTKENVDIG